MPDFLHHPLLILKPEGFRWLIENFGLAAVCLMIFAESGVFPMLPGDSLLVVCGIYAAGSTLGAAGQPLLSLAWLMTLVPLCGVLGAQAGFGIGRLAGSGVYRWKDASLGFVPVYRRDWLRRTEDFFGRWGAFAVVAGRWVPFVRTGAPLLAGVTKMSWTQYTLFNVLGALSWVWSMVLVGYFLPPVVARFAPGVRLEDRIDLVVVAVILVSLVPVFYTVARESRQTRGGGSAGARGGGPGKGSATAARGHGNAKASRGAKSAKGRKGRG